MFLAKSRPRSLKNYNNIIIIKKFNSNIITVNLNYNVVTLVHL